MVKIGHDLAEVKDQSDRSETDNKSARKVINNVDETLISEV